MVRLSRIYTRTGDDGSTALGDGTRLPKHHLRIEAYGTVDEVSSVLGLLLTEEIGPELVQVVRTVQNDLFDVGSDLAVPGEAGRAVRVPASYVTRLEEWIDTANEPLEPLDSFILPGGTRPAAWLHVARTVCRRAERLACALAETDPKAVNPEVIRYLNRLSDLLFVLARGANDGGKGDVLWVPGQSKTGEQEPE